MKVHILRRQTKAGVWMPRTKATQGFNADVQYSALTEARSKRKKRTERNQQVIMAGGYKQIPIITV